MRLTRADFSFRGKIFLKIEFAPQDITGFSELELLLRYLALIELGRRGRTVFARYEMGGDYRSIDMILVIVVLRWVGGGWIIRVIYAAIRTQKNYQLERFDPEDGYYEYSAVGTNLELGAAAL